MKIYEAIILRANQPDINDDIHTKECLENMAKDDHALRFDGENLWAKFIDVDGVMDRKTT